MLSKKIRNFLLFGVIAALFAAVGYWNISPERFLDKPAVAVDEHAIDYYANNAHSLQYLPDGKLQYITDTATFVLETAEPQQPVELMLVRTGGQ